MRLHGFVILPKLQLFLIPCLGVLLRLVLLRTVSMAMFPPVPSLPRTFCSQYNKMAPHL